MSFLRILCFGVWLSAVVGTSPALPSPGPSTGESKAPAFWPAPSSAPRIQSTPTPLRMASGPSWEELLPTLPEGQVSIYDPLRDRMLLAGGDLLWAFSLAAPHDWDVLATSGSPPPAMVVSKCAAYDPLRDRLLVLGLRGDGTTSIRVWSLSLPTLAWSELDASGTAPTNWAGPSVTYDPIRDRLVVLGGSNGSNYTNEVWALSLAGSPTWSALTPVGVPPSGRAAHTAVYDSARDRLLVYGGVNNPFFQGLSDLWQLSLNGPPSWSEISASGTLPGGQYVHTAVYDAIRDRMIVFGGYGGTGPRSDVWAFVPSPSPAWVQLIPSGRIAPRGTHTAILDPVRDAMVVYGGRGHLNFPYFHDVMALQLEATPEWVDLAPLPPGRSGLAAALDTRRKRLLVFGGLDGSSGYLNDLWALSLEGPPRWSRVSDGVGPTPRRHATLVYDHEYDRVVVFGGEDGSQSFDDTWVLPLAGPAWSPVVGGGPASRYGHSMVLDAARQRAVVFGGATRIGWGSIMRLNDSWALKLGAAPSWESLETQGGPPAPRLFHAAAFDALGDRLIVHGGFADDSLRDDVWELRAGDGMKWADVTPSGPTSPGVRDGRYGHGLVVDTQHPRLIMFGGKDSTRAYDDLWELDLQSPLSWRPINVEAPRPEPRSWFGIASDYAAGGLLVFGGGGAGNDCWRLTLDHSTSVAASLVEATVVDGRVTISWHVDATFAHDGIVERRTTETPWIDLHHVTSDGNGYISFQDQDVIAGNRYGYRLVLQSADGPVPTEPVWLEVTAPPKLALHGIRPNPGDGPIRLAFSLPDRRPTSLELFDVSGRLLERTEVGALGPGRHEVQLGAGLPAGVFLIRLRSAHDLVVRRAILLR